MTEQGCVGYFQKKKSFVIMSLREYNSIKETMYLMQPAANSKRLDEAIAGMLKGQI